MTSKDNWLRVFRLSAGITLERMTSMLRQFTYLAQAVSTAFIATIGVAHAQCSLKSIHGAYTYTVHGQSLSSDGSTSTGLIDGVGVIEFDGAGNAMQEDFIVKNGSEVPGGPLSASNFHTQETGTYTVNSDCTGTAEITLTEGNTRSLALVISKRGQAIHAIVSAATVGGSPAVLQVYSDFEKILSRNDE